MAEPYAIKENYPFPNHSLPVLFYPVALLSVLGDEYTADDALKLFEKHDYSNGWVNGIHSFHHFHSNTHEVLGCISGKAKVQLGGPDSDVVTFAQGDVLLIPAGVAHKNIKATDDFKIIGAYPEGRDFDMQRGDEENYEELKKAIERVPLPKVDPVVGIEGPVHHYWN